MTNDRAEKNSEATSASPAGGGFSPGELDEWIDRTAKRALAYAVTLVGNPVEAEDLVHDCYCRLLAKSAEYDLPRDGEKLLFKAVTNACINSVQRRRPVASLDSVKWSDHRGLAESSETNPERRAEARELHKAVSAALAKLPVNQRAVVELRSLGHSVMEAAEMLEISHANARVLLHRARQTLAVELRPFLNNE